MQQQVAQAGRERAVAVGGGDELLGEERIALGASDDRVDARRRHRSVGPGGEQRRDRVVREWAELEPQRRPRALDACGEPMHAVGRRRLVGAVGGDQQDPPVVEVVGEEHHEIEGRGIRPVDVLEHEQHRRRRARAVSRASTSSNTFRCEPALPASSRSGSPSGRRASTNGWYASSVPMRSIERPSRTSKPASRARRASRSRAASCRCRLLPRRAPSPPARSASPRARPAVPRARGAVRRRPRSGETPFRPVSPGPRRDPRRIHVGTRTARNEVVRPMCSPSGTGTIG